MIKYIDLKGYHNEGEILPLSHFYRFVERDYSKREDGYACILVRAYRGQATAFKGRVFVYNNTFREEPLTVAELTVLESAVGKIKQVSFRDLIEGSGFEAALDYFKEEKPASEEQ